jgi:hypothetical protein
MTNYFIRVAQELDYEHISKHLLVVGELTGDCFSCRHIGIDYSREKYCPGCKTDFRYISYRRTGDGAGGSQVARLCQRRPDLTYVEYADIKEIADKQKAKGLFK